jgi:hypothetical protein
MAAIKSTGMSRHEFLPTLTDCQQRLQLCEQAERAAHRRRVKCSDDGRHAGPGVEVSQNYGVLGPAPAGSTR